MAADFALGIAATWLAFSLRIDGMHVPHSNEWIPYWFGPLLALPIFIHFGLYRAIFRYTDLAAIKQILKAVVVYAAIYTTVVLAFYIPPNPRSIGILQPFILSAFIVGVRMFARFWLLSSNIDPRLRVLRRRLLIVGTGDDAVQLANALKGSPEYIQIGFVTNDTQLIGRNMAGYRVFSLNELRKIIENYEVSDLVIALGSGAQGTRRQIIEQCKGLPVHIQTAGLTLDSQHSSIRELDIDDLLGRDHIPPNVELLNLKNHNKVVLVTGAGGSIGSELCRQILATRPARLVLFENNEFALYALHHELQQKVNSFYREVQLSPVLGDVRDAHRLREVFSAVKPHTVYHAAAYKHVPLVELNPFEGIRNNFLGTRLTAKVANELGVDDFVLISTDKAVRPTNIMGASKRLAELALQSLADEPDVKTRFSMVRFGNVLGSSGSVVPLFRQQIAKLGPVTITDAEVTRFFMTIPEAAQLVIQAGAMAKGGDVFVLDMGEPIRIIDLAKRMITLAGYTVKEPGQTEGDIEIKVTGLRPGEKLYEELLIGNDPKPTGHPRIMKANEKSISNSALDEEVEALQNILQTRDVPELKNLLLRLVDGYQAESETYDALTSISK
ncbi:polysaccharide biosynthesis protein [Limnobacter sp.]|jgi:FlaA1/EpsC-like NDP-sugar epimerase|uniref:polysaccharide biosynthesis protein n=1 Tax=Limnobacter sp. TaxID=2003368 RepID=UPI003747DBCD